jgi:hypothetical protein
MFFEEDYRYSKTLTLLQPLYGKIMIPEGSYFFNGIRNYTLPTW